MVRSASIPDRLSFALSLQLFWFVIYSLHLLRWIFKSTMSWNWYFSVNFFYKKDAALWLLVEKNNLKNQNFLEYNYFTLCAVNWRFNTKQSKVWIGSKPSVVRQPRISLQYITRKSKFSLLNTNRSFILGNTPLRSVFKRISRCSEMFAGSRNGCQRKAQFWGENYKKYHWNDSIYFRVALRLKTTYSSFTSLHTRDLKSYNNSRKIKMTTQNLKT